MMALPHSSIVSLPFPVPQSQYRGPVMMSYPVQFPSLTPMAVDMTIRQESFSTLNLGVHGNARCRFLSREYTGFDKSHVSIPQTKQILHRRYVLQTPNELSRCCQENVCHQQNKPYLQKNRDDTKFEVEKHKFVPFSIDENLQRAAEMPKQLQEPNHKPTPFSCQAYDSPEYVKMEEAYRDVRSHQSRNNQIKEPRLQVKDELEAQSTLSRQGIERQIEERFTDNSHSDEVRQAFQHDMPFDCSSKERWMKGENVSKDDFKVSTKHALASCDSSIEIVHGKKPRFDFANLPRSVSKENESRNPDAERCIEIISHVVAQFRSASGPSLPSSLQTKLKKHTKNLQTRTKKQFICRFCHREFTKSYNLLIHERTHTDERPFTCEACGKAFRRQDHLRDHRYIHSKEKPFKCAECGKGFCQARTLTVHKAMHLQALSKPQRRRRVDRKTATQKSSSMTSSQKNDDVKREQSSI